MVTKLKRYKYINDLDFANWLVNSRLKSKSPRSLRIIQSELRIKGIGPKIIEKVSQSFPSEVELVKKALTKKLKMWQGLDPMAFKKKAYTYLASRGFSFDSIKDAVAFYTEKR